MSPGRVEVEPMRAEHAEQVLTIYQLVGRSHGRWRDVLLLERRGPAVT